MGDGYVQAVAGPGPILPEETPTNDRRRRAGIQKGWYGHTAAWSRSFPPRSYSNRNERRVEIHQRCRRGSKRYRYTVQRKRGEERDPVARKIQGNHDVGFAEEVKPQTITVTSGESHNREWGLGGDPARVKRESFGEFDQLPTSERQHINRSDNVEIERLTKQDFIAAARVDYSRSYWLPLDDQRDGEEPGCR